MICFVFSMQEIMKNYAFCIREELKHRILVMDGAMGTMIQQCGLTEEDFRGLRFADVEPLQKGNLDLLSVTQPDIIAKIHHEYLSVGADIIETNTFNANAISQIPYQMQEVVYEMNFQSAKIARLQADSFTKKKPEKPRFVAGSIGPTSKSASLSPDVGDPAKRNISFDQLYHAYYEQVVGLLLGGVHIFLVETIFDTLNAKAALMAIEHVLKRHDAWRPVMVSGTIVDRSGRTLSGQTARAFLHSLSHADIISIGLNCSLGAVAMLPFVKEMAVEAPFYISVYPNAGMPDELGRYSQTPHRMAELMKEYLAHVNIIGGCCGSTPQHIQELVQMVNGRAPRQPSSQKPLLNLSGLDAFTVRPGMSFVNISERCNVAGSRRFAQLIRQGDYQKAVEIAASEVRHGAAILDLNVDDGLIDGVDAMTSLLNTVVADPDIAKVPLMIDSSDWRVLEAGLKCVQGKAIVNSISLKDGERLFLEKGAIIKSYGAAVVVMAFDETGQAIALQHRIDVCKRSYYLLTERLGFPPQDIIFDPNVLALGIGIVEHNHSALDFIDVVRWIKMNLPHTCVIAGVSNLSFAFRGNNRVREAMHAVFLYHAIEAGLDMGIVNVSRLPEYKNISRSLRDIVENLILNRDDNATDKLLAWSGDECNEFHSPQPVDVWRTKPVEERLIYALRNGVVGFLKQDLEEIYRLVGDSSGIDSVLLDGMHQVGELFKEGKMFLPQVVKSARVMKEAMKWLQPLLTKQNASDAPKKSKVLLATVKGDVHDIGKNMAGLVLMSNNIDVVDAGVMVPARDILAIAEHENATIIGLSGLITPSIAEMEDVARLMEDEKWSLPLLIGGASVSELQVAVKIAPLYKGPVVYVADASAAVGVVRHLLNDSDGTWRRELEQRYDELRMNYLYKGNQKAYRSLSEARENKLKLFEEGYTPSVPLQKGEVLFDDYPLRELIPYIDWTPLFHAWDIKGVFPQLLSHPIRGSAAYRLYNDAKRLLGKIQKYHLLRMNGVAGVFPALSNGDDVEVYKADCHGEQLAVFHFLRNMQVRPDGGRNLCLSDFVAPRNSEVCDYLGAFVLTAGHRDNKVAEEIRRSMDDYESMLFELLAYRLVEAFAEKVHEIIRTQLWGYESGKTLTAEQLIKKRYQGIRVAPGYPSMPDHSAKMTLFSLLNATGNTGVQLTDNYMMLPGASVCALCFSHPDAKFFDVGKISIDQLNDYARRKQMNVDVVKKMLAQRINYYQK